MTARLLSLLAQWHLTSLDRAQRTPGFGPADRLALIEAAERAGWEPWLCWWPSRGQQKAPGGIRR